MIDDPRTPLALEAYETLAEAYAARIDTKPHNAYYERPATLSLMPEVRGLSVLDAGCGPGVYLEWLLAHGAEVTGLDVSPTMIRLARERAGSAPALIEHNLSDPMPFLADGSVDLVLSSLALDYIRDWEPVFREFHRILKPRGPLIFSMEHPGSRWRMKYMRSYFEVERQDMEWRGFGVNVVMPSYRRSLGAVAQSLAGTGFVIERIVEPRPTEEFLRADPKDYEELMREPGFLCLRARRE